MNLQVVYNGPLINPAIDTRIEHTVGFERDGSGVCFGERDLQFTVDGRSKKRIGRELDSLALEFGYAVGLYHVFN